jgi:hypothetical protein
MIKSYYTFYIVDFLISYNYYTLFLNNCNSHSCISYKFNKNIYKNLQNLFTYI